MSNNDQVRRNLTVEANALEDVDVTAISLVKRGANRIPFKILKSENGMSIDLGKIFLRKKEEVTPEIVAVAINKSDDIEGLVKAVEATGFVVAKREDTEDGVLLLAKEDANLEELTVFKSDENVAVMVSHVAKEFAPWAAGGSFSEEVAVSGFYPSFRVGVEALGDAIFMALDSAQAGGIDAQAKVDEVLNEFHAYVLTLVGKLPATVFKMDKLVPVEDEEVAKEDTTETNEVVKSETTDEEIGAGSGTMDTEVAKEETEVTDDVAKEEATDEVTDEESVAKEETATDKEEVAKEEDTKVEPSMLDQILKGVSKMLDDRLGTVTDSVAKTEESIAALETKIDGVAKSADDTLQRVEEVESVAKAATEAVIGNVGALDTGSDDDTQVSNDVKKTSGGIWDSALKF